MTQFFVQAFLALALGGLIGLERERAGKTLVGVRSFASTSFFGFLITLLKNDWLVAIGLLGATVFAALLYYVKSSERFSVTSLGSTRGKGITTVLMVPFCFILGVMVGNNLFLEAGVATIAVTFLLVEKQQVHAFVLTIHREEVIDMLLFAVVTFIVFPLLPSTTFAVYGLSFNLQYAWAVVVIVSAISFVTHFVIKYVKHHGLEYAAFLGGVISSLATLSVFSNRIKGDSPVLVSVLSLVSAGALVGDLVLIATISPALFEKSTLPLLLILVIYGSIYKWFGRRLVDLHVPPGRHPLSLKFIVEFAVVFLIISAIINAAASNQTNLFLTSFLSGLASSTSAVASVGYLFIQGRASASTATIAFVLAKWASLLAKTTLLAVRYPLHKELWIPLALAVVTGAAGLWMMGAF